MARLNEVPAPAAESLESIKRRFIRQNREIARINSNQSIRIRNLETEISRLLAENIAIREEAINVRAKAEKWRASHRLNKEVLRMKEQLEVKLFEVTALVGELGALPEKVARRSSQRRRKDGFFSELVKSSEEKEPRQRQTLAEPDGRLPAILEDKYYPRRTLDANEIRGFNDDPAANSLESPDLGPPPVAHFEEHEALAFNPSKSPRRTSTELIEDSETTNRPPSTSFENRRKRRTSTLLHSSILDEEDQPELRVPEPIKTKIPEPEKQSIPVQPQSILKTGAKRKLDASELEDTSRVSKELDDFICQRKSAMAPVTTARPSRFTRPPGRQDQENVASITSQSPERPAQLTRKILAPKTTNSPAKRRPDTTADKSCADKNDFDEAKTDKRLVSRNRSRAKNAELLPTTQQVIQLRVDEAENSQDEDRRVQPKTPASDLEGIGSPISTEPSTKQRPAKEMAVINSVEDVLNGSISRGSRRAKAAVSYAPPKLNTKMRRPDKMVGAVEGYSRTDSFLQPHAKNVSADDEDGARQSSRSQRAVKIKEDSATDGSRERARWENFGNAQGGKSEPASPLGNRQAPASRESDHEELNQVISRLSMYDAPTSSPATTDQEARPSEEPWKAAARTRRPSSALELRQPEKQSAASSAIGRSRTTKSASVSTLPNASQLASRRKASAVQDSANMTQEATQAARTGGLSRRSMLV